MPSTETLSLQPGDRFTRQTSEVYRGHKLTVKKSREWGYLETFINGHPLGRITGGTNAHALRELRSLRGYVDDAAQRPDAYTNGLGEYAFDPRLAPKR